MDAEARIAERAGLIYENLDKPGYRRKRWGRGFFYEDPLGKRVDDRQLLRRMKSLVIPPAWKEVWINPSDRGHIQVTGRDARGRKQYIYHPDWREISNLTKFERLAHFGRQLPFIRRQVEKDLDGPDWSRRKTTALVIRLLDKSLVRIGNAEYEKANQSFGLTTLNQDHVELKGNVIHLSFRGKRGKEIEVDVESVRLARMIRKCEALPGQKLFQYRDENGDWQTLESNDVNAFLQGITGEDFTAKDFRTWGATVLAAEVFSRMNSPEITTARKRAISRGIKEVAKQLGNTPTICRKYYVHPMILEAFENNRLFDLAAESARSAGTNPALSVFERVVLDLLNGGETRLEQAI